MVPPPPLFNLSQKDAGKNWKFLTQAEEEILAVMKDSPDVKAIVVAKLLKRNNDSSFRTILANLVERMILNKSRKGYVLNK
jgi:uncharacterized protein (DUF736 family)